MWKIAPAALLLWLAPAAAPAAAQGIVVDQGQFTVSVRGRRVGTEDFVIRRAGLGVENAIFASGVVKLQTEGGAQEIHPLLSATPPDGTADSYQVRVVGPGQMELRLNKSGRRYVARISSAIGDEDREFPARDDTRILEQGVAHQYYFLRDLREGRRTHVLEPRTRRQLDLMAGPRVDEEIHVGLNVVQARRLDLSDGEDRRIVWYDRQGRVLRVEVPGSGYVAERTDIVG